MTRSVLDPAVLDSLRELPSPDGRSMVVCVAELYLRDAAALVASIDEAARAGDLAALAAAAHALKSYAGNVGATALAAQLRGIEAAAKAGDSAACTTEMATLADTCAALEESLAIEARRP